MSYKYSLLMIITLVASHIAFATENPFDTDLSEKIHQANEDLIKEGKEALKNLTGTLIHLNKDEKAVEEKLQEKSSQNSSGRVKTKMHTVYELIDELATLHSVDDFTKQLKKIQESFNGLVQTGEEEYITLKKLHYLNSIMNQDQKNNLTYAMELMLTQEMPDSMKNALPKEAMETFVNEHNKKYATEIANGTMTKLEYADASEQLTPEKQEDLINEYKRGPFLNRIVRLYSQYKFAMIAGSTALLTGICALLYKAYQKYYDKKNTQEAINQKNISCTVIPTKR